jgi:hypothetical protein
MRSQFFISIVAGLWLGASSVLAQTEAIKLSDETFDRFLAMAGEDQEYWPRHFRLGALMGFNFKAQFSMGGMFKFSQNNPGAAGVGGLNRVYDDGYVMVDVNGTGNGTTWNWGYQSTNQISGSGSSQRLLFYAADTYTANGSAEATSDAEFGGELTYGGHLARWGKVLVGWEFGFGYLPINIEDSRTINGVDATRVTHSFDAADLILPDPPYTGTFNGPGALLGDNPTQSTETVLGRDLVGKRNLDVTMYSFRLGPAVHWELHPRWAVAASAGAAMAIFSGELKFNESVTFDDGSTARSIGSISSTELTYGGYVSATLLFHAVENGDFYLGVQYMPLGDATFSGVGRQANLDMSGAVYISAGINWPF